MFCEEKMSYVHPEVLVDTQWAEDHLKGTKVRIAEVDYDAKENYELGNINGDVLFDWKNEINDQIKLPVSEIK